MRSIKSVPISSDKENGHSVHSAEKTHSISHVAAAVGVSLRQLYYWERIGIIAPIYEQFGSYSYRRYRESDLDLLSRVKSLLDAGFTLKAASEKAKREFKSLAK